MGQQPKDYLDLDEPEDQANLSIGAISHGSGHISVRSIISTHQSALELLIRLDERSIAQLVEADHYKRRARATRQRRVRLLSACRC